MLTRRTLLAAAPLVAAPSDGPARAASWAAIEQAGRGSEIFFNAWGGDDRTNAFIAWAGERMRMLYGARVRHVRLGDTAEAVARVAAEKAAGRVSGGTVDLVWINGPNFLAMRQQGLLAGPILNLLPNAALIDRIGRPDTLVDFTVPTQGYEVPWRMAQVVFIYDAARTRSPPRSMAAMPAWAKATPGRLTHPNARDFMGATFLKEALVELAPDRALLAHPATDAAYPAATARLWDWYAALRPNLWRRGTDFPATGPDQASLLNDEELDLFISFNPAEAAVGIAHGTLPDTVRAYVLDGGTLANCSFVAIPYDAAHRDGALLLANFLLSPEAQAHMADPAMLGSPSVLDLRRLDAADRARFTDLPRPPGLLDAAALGTPLPEPHPSWMTRITADWERRVMR